MNALRLVPACLLAALSSAATADPVIAPSHPVAAPGGMTAIPQAAFDVCVGKSAGAEVIWKGMHGNPVKGICRPFGGNTLVALPSSVPALRPGGGPPPGAPGTALPSGVTSASTAGTINPGGRIPAPGAAPVMGNSMLKMPLTAPK